LILLKKEKQTKTVSNDPEYYIDTYFRELIDEMQLRKEEALESIKNYFENVIEKIQQRKADLLK
jgi:hypothetical protein